MKAIRQTARYFTLSILLVIFINIDVYSQRVITDNLAVRSSIDDMFSELDKSRVPTGLLLDYAIDIIEFDKYDGRELTDSNYVSISVLGDILNCINSASVTGKTPVGDVGQFIESFTGSCRGNNIPIGLAFFRYNYIKENVLEDGLLIYDEASEKAFDAYRNGEWQNPYGESFIAAFAPAADVITSLDVTYEFQDVNLLSNIIDSYEIQFDAGDGLGYRRMVSGSSISIRYSDFGIKDLKMLINHEGKNIELHSQIYATPPVIKTLETKKPTSIISKELKYNGVSVEAQMSCYLISDKLTKPFIVVEGFDPWELMEMAGKHSIRETVNLGWTTHLEFYSDNKEYLNNYGYDLIYIDWNNTNADIKANAQLLIALIKEINLMKLKDECVEPSILMGQSMGGLVSRYALCSMENDGLDHQISTFISHDTPHLGANIPLGALYFAHQAFCLVHGYQSSINLANLFTNNKFSKQEKILYNTLYSKSVRQMLINYVTPSGKLDNTEHDEWQNELFRMGFPKRTQNLSIVNGRAYTKTWAYDSHYLYVEGSAKTKFWVEFFAPILNHYTGNLLSDFLYSIDLKALRNTIRWWGSNKLYFNAEINPLSSRNQSRTLSEINLKFRKKYLWLVSKTYTLFYDKRSMSLGKPILYDDMPGSKYELSWYESDDEYYKVEDTCSNAVGKLQYKVGVVGQFMFIPTASALCVGNNGKIDENSSMTDFFSTPPLKQSCPFDAYYLYKKAASHISISSSVFDWIKQQTSLEIIGPQRAESGDKFYVRGMSGMKFSTTDKTKADINSSGEIRVIGSGSVGIIAEKYDNGEMYRVRKDIIVDFPDMLIDYSYNVTSGYTAKVRMLNVSDMEYIDKMVSAGEIKYEWIVFEDGKMQSWITDQRTFSHIPSDKGLEKICVRLVDGEKKGTLFSVIIDDQAIFKLTYPYVIINSEGVVIAPQQDGYIGPMNSNYVFSIMFNAMPSGIDSNSRSVFEHMKESGCYIDYMQRFILPMSRAAANAYSYGPYVSEENRWEFDFFNSSSFLNALREGKYSKEEKIISEYSISLHEPSDRKQLIQNFKFIVLSKPNFLVVKPLPDPDPDIPIIKPII